MSSPPDVVTSIDDVTIDVIPPRREATDPVRPTQQAPVLVTRAQSAISEAARSQSRLREQARTNRAETGDTNDDTTAFSHSALEPDRPSPSNLPQTALEAKRLTPVSQWCDR